MCSECDKDYPIVNKKYGLCGECNYKRLHNGQTREEVYAQRRKAKSPSIAKPLGRSTNARPLVARKRIKPITAKKAERDRKMHETYRRIDTTRERKCQGCLRIDLPLSHSHILSQGNRPDLAADEENIQLHCFGDYLRCHEKWERGIINEVKHMADFERNLQYIKQQDEDAYNKIIAKMQYEEQVIKMQTI